MFRRRQDGTLCSAAITFVPPNVLETILLMDDCTDPQDKAEARAVAYGCLYAGMDPPAKAVNMLKGKLPIPATKFLYCCMPFSDKKTPIQEFAKNRDKKYKLEYNEDTSTCKGGVSSETDLATDIRMAKQAGMTMTNIPFESEETNGNGPTTEEMQGVIDQRDDIFEDYETLLGLVEEHNEDSERGAAVARNPIEIPTPSASHAKVLQMIGGEGCCGA